MSPIRVAFYDHVATLSGGEIALLNLIRSMDKSKVEPIVILGEHGPLEDLLRGLAETRVLPLKQDLKDARKDSLGGGGVSSSAVFGVGLYVWRLSRVIKALKADIVHTNSLKGHLLGGLAAKLSRTALIWHMRDRIMPDYLPAKAVSLVRLMARLLPDRILANSHATAATLGHAVADRVQVVHDGVMVEQFKSVPAPFPPGRPPTVGLLGRISPWKGQDIFAHAASLVRKTHPEVVYQIIGAPMFQEVEFERTLHQLVVSLGLSDVITFTGFKQDVQSAMGELDIVAHASTIPEPFGQVIIEGMAAGRPVIAVNAGAVPEIIQDGTTGCLFQVSDPVDLARAITTLIDDIDAANAMGLRGQRHVVENFSMSKTALEVTIAYSQILRRL